MERKVGTIARGIRCPIIREGDDLSSIVVNSVLEAAEQEGFAALAARFRMVGAIEKMHEERYRELLRDVQVQAVFEKSSVKVWECRNCGHIVVGTSAPKVCPACHYPQGYYEVREDVRGA